ncbi:MAG: phosphate ABC transporter permease PstA [Actinomycetota bacterium]
MSATPFSLTVTSRRRLSRARVANRVFTAFLWGAGLVALLPLGFIGTYVIVRGARVISLNFFTHTPAVIGFPGGGISQAFVGSALIVGMAVLMSVPLGLLAAVYLAEYGHGRLASAVRFLSEVLLSTPSIVAGVVIWTLVVLRLHSFSAFAGALSLTVLMWPIIARAAEDVLRLVPIELREAGTALGSPKWKVVLRVVIPAAAAGLTNTVLLALARGLGETAPLLLTSLGSDFVNTSPLRRTDALSLRIFQYALSPVKSWIDIAWGAALSLLVIVLILSLAARVLSARTRRLA